MKSKSVSTSGRGRPPKQKVIKREVDEIVNIRELAGSEFQNMQDERPSVEIVSCISYQKFRYSGENRPGKKYQEKDFMELKLLNLGDKVVRVVIICTDAENKELIHPNGLVGKDCHDGIYDKEYAITKQHTNVKIPYLRTERIKTKKNELSKIRDILKSRAEHLPSPYRERCESQCTDQYTFNRKFDTTKVCLGVIVTVRSHFQGAVNGSLHAISHVVNNASEKTSLGILKLSCGLFSASKGGCVDIFTTEDGPAIESDKYYLHVSYDKDEGILWESERISPAKSDILYKRIVSYTVPPFGYNTDIEEPVEATLHLRCPSNNQSCDCSIMYTPQGTDFVYYDENTTMKRSYTEELEEIKPPKRMRLNDRQNSDVKAVLKESLKRREDDKRNGNPPAVEIVERFNDGALVRRPDSHTVPGAMDQDVYNQSHSSHSPNGQDDQRFQVLCAAYSKAVPSDTVLIITNDGPEDIENAISKGVSYFENPSIKADPSVKTITRKSVVPVSKSPDREASMITRQQANAMPRPPVEDIIASRTETREPQSVNFASPLPVTSKKNHKTDSPWAVGSDDESDEAMNIFNELSNNKQNHFENRPKSTSSSQRVLHIGGQRTISVLSSKRDAMSKVINKDGQHNSKSPTREDNQDLDFSRVQLPSDINLSSEIIANFPLVTGISSDEPQLTSQ